MDASMHKTGVEDGSAAREQTRHPYLAIVGLTATTLSESLRTGEGHHFELREKE
jgi:hypothetical protein